VEEEEDAPDGTIIVGLLKGNNRTSDTPVAAQECLLGATSTIRLSEGVRLYEGKICTGRA
jgi:hypothetical protein